MNLAEKMKKFVTVKKTKCPKCRNSWFFLHPSLHECTTCGAGYKRETVTHDDDTIALGALMLMAEMSGSSPIVTPDYNTSPELQSEPSVEPFEGGGGSFNGAGASGSWDDTPPSDSGSSSFDSSPSDSGSSFDSGSSSFGD